MVPVRVAPLPPGTAPPIPPRVLVTNSVAEIDQHKPNDYVLTQPSKGILYLTCYGFVLVSYFYDFATDIENALARRQEFKNAALQAKRAGEQAAALQFVRLVKVNRTLIFFFFCVACLAFPSWGYRYVTRWLILQSKAYP